MVYWRYLGVRSTADPLHMSPSLTLFHSPIIGGSLSRPAEHYPSIFGDWEFFKKYPYFLACSIPATFSLVACLTTFFFLKEVSQSLIPANSCA